MIKKWFKFVPADAITDRGLYSNGEWLAAWQWLVRHLAALKRMQRRDYGIPYEWINNTSSIHNSGPDPISEGSEHCSHVARKRIADLLKHAGEKSGRGKFLSSIGLPSWASLMKPVLVTVQTSDEFPRLDWFQMRGRIFKVSPNSVHPKATWVSGAALKLQWEGTRWALVVEYGYPHDGSRWYWNIIQNAGERIDDFAARADAEVEAAMEPDTYPHGRICRERAWNNIYKSLTAAFADTPKFLHDWEDQLADVMVDIPGGGVVCHKIALDGPRFGTLMRWARQTAGSAAPRGSK